MNFAILTTYQGEILGPIARLLGKILEWLYLGMAQVGVENVGICMILFTFIVNGLMIPLTFKQQKFSKLSSVMNPEIQAVQKKYKNKKDPESQQKMSRETQAIYQKYGVSPASGCLPMFITLPILFALYRVIYNIPAYVKPVYKIYEGIAQKVSMVGISVEDLSKMTKTNTYIVTDAVKAKSSDINYYIDVLGQFNKDAWKNLAEVCNAKGFASLAAEVNHTSDKAMHINSFLGLNIADLPTVPFIGGAALSLSLIIPILSVITQIISTKLSMASSPQQVDPDNPTAQSMQTMTKVMPYFSGIMCFMFPIGVGIYWVAGNVFRIFQSLGINWYFGRMDVDELIQKNVKKTKERYAKIGQEPDKAFLEATKKKKIDIDSSKVKDTEKAAKQKKAKEKADKEKIRKDKSLANIKYDNSSKKKYKKGSIADYANIMNRDND